MSDSVQPHRRQPTRLHRPWDSPGKNTGVGCHFLLQCRKVKSESEVAQSCPTLSDTMDCSPPGKSTGVGCHCLLPYMSFQRQFRCVRVTLPVSLYVSCSFCCCCKPYLSTVATLKTDPNQLLGGCGCLLVWF